MDIKRVISEIESEKLKNRIDYLEKRDIDDEDIYNEFQVITEKIIKYYRTWLLDNYNNIKGTNYYEIVAKDFLKYVWEDEILSIFDYTQSEFEKYIVHFIANDSNQSKKKREKNIDSIYKFIIFLNNNGIINETIFNDSIELINDYK